MSEDASPFTGWLPPTENWSKLPHQFIEALPKVETIGEMKVILYVLRHTWGYQDEEKKITVDEFMLGRKKRDGTRIDNGTGLTAPTVQDGIRRALEHGFIEVETDSRDKGRIKRYYSLKMQGGEPKKDENQGEKVFTPGTKGLGVRDKKALPRSEKETPDTNPSIETFSGAKAPHMEVPSNGNGNGSHAVSQPSFLAETLPPSPHSAPPPPPKKAPPSAAEGVYREIVGRFPVLAYRADLSTITEPGDLEYWGLVVKEWVGHGWNKTNVADMFRFYQEHRGDRALPKVNGKQDQNQRIIAANLQKIARQKQEAEQTIDTEYEVRYG